MKKIIAFGLGLVLSSSNVFAQSDSNISYQDLQKEISNLKNLYETRVNSLETKLNKMENNQNNLRPMKVSSGNSFNPAIGIILNGTYSSFSQNQSEIKGFAVSHEGERGQEGFSLGESELNFSANIDDKFTGSLTASIVSEDGSDSIELEESYIKTRPELGLPVGMDLKFGRALWSIGYLNDHHAHSDDFADRPLPNRIFLNSAYNDDGAQLSYILPTDFYLEVGGGLFAGRDFPSGSNASDAFSNYSFYSRIGSDIGNNQNWRLGASVLKNKSKGRKSNDDNLEFIGDTSLYVLDFRYELAPTSNPNNSQIIFQSEYFLRDENGTYEDTDAATGKVNLNKKSNGWYSQLVYKFNPNWRIGYRYTALNGYSAPAALQGSLLDGKNHNPSVNSIMLDWTNSEFSRIRLQYSQDKTVFDKTDNQVMLQYVMSIGAHGAHQY